MFKAVPMRKILIFAALAILFLYPSVSLYAQKISKEELLFLTSAWKGERFPDGRPKIPDDLIRRARNIGMDDAWTALKNLGYIHQFEGGWKMLNDSTPVIGRALTAMYMPPRRGEKYPGAGIKGRKNRKQQFVADR